LVHRRNPVFAIGNAPFIPSLARLEGFDVVHLHYPFIFGADLTLLGRLRRRRRSQALLVHYKNRLVGDAGRGLLFEAYEHTIAPALIRAADRVCVLSPDHAESVSYLRKTGERDPGKLIVMPNGVDAERFSPGSDSSGLRERLGIPADALVAAFVATLDRAHHFKRLDVAIDALAELGDPAAHIVVAGGGELVDDFRRRAAERRVGGQVHFLGAVPHPELPDVLRASDLFLLTTEPPESFGIVLIEALACGTPVFAYRRGSIPEIIEDGVTGFICDSLDEMVTKIDRLPLIKRQRCRESFQARFTAERMVKDYLAVYERMATVPARAHAFANGRSLRMVGPRPVAVSELTTAHGTA